MWAAPRRCLMLLLPLQSPLLHGAAGGHAPAAGASESHLKYFTWYDVGSGPLMNATASYTNLRLSSTIEQASVTKTQFQQDSLLAVESVLWYYPKGERGFRLRPDVHISWAAVAPVAAQLLANESIIGFNLGDELVWNCLPPNELQAGVDLIRKSFPRVSSGSGRAAIIWYNEAVPVLTPGISQCNRSVGQPMMPYTIPAGIDWFSIDMYHSDGPEPGWVGSHVRKFYEEQIYPNLTVHQRALLVPGAFGSHVNHFPNGTYVCNNSCYDQMCALDAAEYYEWAKQDPRVVAIAPWDYNGCPNCNGSRWTPPHTCCMDEIGAKEQPLTLAAYKKIGLEIKQQSVGSPTPSIFCNLSNGAWSNSKTTDIGHIEFDQQQDGTVFVHSAHWNNKVGWGTIHQSSSTERGGYPTLDVHMVNAPSTQHNVGPVTASPYPHWHTKAPAPPCTYWHSGAGDTWCRFPYCPVAEPAWAPLPRPLLPRWKPTWNLAASTIIQPCNSSGYMDPEIGAAFGIVSYDYNNGRAVWEAQAKPQCEEMAVEQCRRMKLVNPSTKCWVYRNTELAFAALSTDRQVMSRANASLFIHFRNASACAQAPCPPRSRAQNFCCPFAGIYQEGNPGWGRFSQFPTHPNMRLWLWDYRNPAAADYLLRTRILGKAGLGSQHVSGFFTDDPAGLGQEHPKVVARVGYGANEATECRAAQVRALRRAQEAIVGHGGFDWQLLTQVNAVTNATCLAQLQEWCSPPHYQTRVAWQMNVYADWQKEIKLWPALPDFAQRLAAFLLARGPFAWFGYGFAGCDFPVAPEFLGARHGLGPMSIKLGEPLEYCHEEAKGSGIFVRRWSSGKTTRLDCNTWHATLA